MRPGYYRGVPLHQNDAVSDGTLESSKQAQLCDEFARTHLMMSGSTPSTKQFPPDEQYEMFLLCEVQLAGNKNELDKEQTETNVLELIRYLNGNGVRIPDIIPEVRRFNSALGSPTRRLVMGLHVGEYRRQRQEAVKASMKAGVVFKEPTFA